MLRKVMDCLLRCLCKKEKKKKKHSEKQYQELQNIKNNQSSTISGCTEPGAGKTKYENQDTFLIIDIPIDRLKFYAIFDGHGNVGQNASRKANQFFDDIIRKNSKKLRRMKDKQIKKFLVTNFNNCQKRYKKDRENFYFCGTCCIAVLQLDQRQYIINLGNSRAVLCTSRSLTHLKNEELYAQELSSDHKPDRQTEKDRIIKYGGIVVRDEEAQGPYRIWANDDGPGLQVTRTLGDLCGHKIGVTCEPEIEVRDIQQNDVLVVLASEGLWNNMNSDEVVDFISKNSENITDISYFLANEAKERWNLSNSNRIQQYKLSLEGMDEVEKKSKLMRFTDYIIRDDITVVIAYLQNIN